MARLVDTHVGAETSAGHGAGSRCDTWPKVLAENCERYGDRRKAMRHKRYGIWQAYSWKDYYFDVKHLALGLLALGFEAEDKLLIIGDNAPQWYFAELAAQANRGAAVGLYPDLAAAEVAEIARTVDVRFAVVQDQEQVDKLLEIKGELPLLEKIVFWSYKGLAHYDDPLLLGYREALELGKAHEGSHPGLFESNVQTGEAGDVCALVLTAGTTGAPKAAVHTHRTLRAGSEYCLRLDPWRETDDLVPPLPPAGIAGQWTGIGCHLLSGCTLNFAESPETQQRDAAEIGPTIVVHEARFWESLAALMQALILDARGIKKTLFRLLLPVGYRLADENLRGRRPALFTRALYRLAHAALLRPVKKKLGLARARICYSTGAHLSPEALRFYHALDLPLKSVYGTTEGGVLAGAASDDIRLETVGPPFEGCEVRISDGGEIVYRQPGVFLGYYDDPAKTAEVVRDGWFHSGDRGRLGEDGHLHLLDRLASVVELADGGQVAPQLVESRLRSSPYIRDAWVFAGPDRAYVAAVVVINYRTVSRWAGQRKIAFNSFGVLAQKKEVYDLVMQDVARVNRDLAPGCRVQRLVLLHREFDPDEGEMTKNRKLRRAILEERYRQLIEAIYAGESEASIETPESRQEGAEGPRRIGLAITPTGAASP